MLLLLPEELKMLQGAVKTELQGGQNNASVRPQTLEVRVLVRLQQRPWSTSCARPLTGSPEGGWTKKSASSENVSHCAGSRLEFSAAGGGRRRPLRGQDGQAVVGDAARRWRQRRQHHHAHERASDAGMSGLASSLICSLAPDDSCLLRVRGCLWLDRDLHVRQQHPCAPATVQSSPSVCVCTHLMKRRNCSKQWNRVEAKLSETFLVTWIMSMCKAYVSAVGKTIPRKCTWCAQSYF